MTAQQLQEIREFSHAFTKDICIRNREAEKYQEYAVPEFRKITEAVTNRVRGMAK